MLPKYPDKASLSGGGKSCVYYLDGLDLVYHTLLYVNYTICDLALEIALFVSTARYMRKYAGGWALRRAD